MSTDKTLRTPMRRGAIPALLPVLLFVVACRAPAIPLGPIPTGIQTDVSFVGNVRQEGRAVGSAGSNRVATYIAARYKSLQLDPAFRTSCGVTPECGDGYFQPFTRQNARNAKNIAAIVQGSDPELRNEYIVVGAHYDHVGRSATLSLDPEKNDEIRPGADDNASGTVAVMELARRLSLNPPRRSVLLVHFDAEEVGLIGSSVFVAMPPVVRSRIRFMLNLDMVGRLRSGGLEVDRSTLMFDDPPLLAVIDSAAAATNVRRSYTKEIEERSDHANFRRADISAMAFFTGFHSDYHRTTDVVALLDVRGIGTVTDIAESVVRFTANRR